MKTKNEFGETYVQLFNLSQIFSVLFLSSFYETFDLMIFVALRLLWLFNFLKRKCGEANSKNLKGKLLKGYFILAFN